MKVCMEKEPKETLEERLDRMWAEHIMACLAIINSYMGEE